MVCAPPPHPTIFSFFYLLIEGQSVELSIFRKNTLASFPCSLNYLPYALLDSP